MKVCVKCKEEKEFICFPKRKDSKDGLRGECKVCKNKVGNNYKKSNIEKVNEQNRLYRIKNIEVFKQNYIKKKDKFLEYNNDYYSKNKDKITEPTPCNICGSIINKSNLPRHKRTKKCLNYKEY